MGPASRLAEGTRVIGAQRPGEAPELNGGSKPKKLCPPGRTELFVVVAGRRHSGSRDFSGAARRQ